MKGIDYRRRYAYAFAPKPFYSSLVLTPICCQSDANLLPLSLHLSPSLSTSVHLCPPLSPPYPDSPNNIQLIPTLPASMKHLEDSEHAAPYGRMGENGGEPPSIDASGTTVKTLRRNDSHYTAAYDPKVEPTTATFSTT